MTSPTETYVARTTRLLDAMLDDDARRELIQIHMLKLLYHAMKTSERDRTCAATVCYLVGEIAIGVICELKETGTLGISAQAVCRALARLADGEGDEA